MKKIFLTSVVLLALTASLSGCNKATTSKTDAPASSAADPAKINAADMKAIITKAVQNSNRLEKDVKLDEARKPDQILEFIGVLPGMKIVELEAGTGYYTEMLNTIVGENGKVYMQNPPAFDGFLTHKKMDPRLGQDGKRLANTEVLRAEFGDLGLADNSADMVTWFLGPHEMFYTVEGTDGMGDAQGPYSEAFRVLKPGGQFILIDHKAAAGTPETSGGDTHRIDPAKVQARAETAGFVLLQTSDILANENDDYSLNIFDPKVRRKTDRFIHMYVKQK